MNGGELTLPRDDFAYEALKDQFSTALFTYRFESSHGKSLLPKCP